MLAPMTASRVLLPLAVIIAFAAASGDAMAQTAKRAQCKSLASLKPRADAIQAVKSRLSYSSIEPSNCRMAQQVVADYRRLMWDAGEACAGEKLDITSIFANGDLFGDGLWNDEDAQWIVLGCESAGLLPLRTSQASCSALAEFENETLKLQREGFKLKNAERTPQVCRDAKSLERRGSAVYESFRRVRAECKSASGGPLPYTNMLIYNPALLLCDSATSPTSYESWFTGDDFRRWFGGTRIIIPVGLIIGLLILVVRLMRRR